MHGIQKITCSLYEQPRLMYELKSRGDLGNEIGQEKVSFIHYKHEAIPLGYTTKSSLLCLVNTQFHTLTTALCTFVEYKCCG
jgi:hypothetical protein